MLRILHLMLCLFPFINLFSQMDNPIIPFDEKSGIYKITGDSYQLLQAFNYQTYFQLNDDGSPKTDNCVYGIKLNNGKTFEIKSIIKNERLCISTFYEESVNLGYTCIGFDLFAQANDKKSFQYCKNGTSSQFRVLYWVDTEMFYVIDIPTTYQSQNVVLHMKVNTME